ncbi:hypothetical protein [Sphingobacterium paludis]|uniref:Uncharacterized protein n=1 Tax=Sphingobacterium paludis TaxID=1476465 RepID=A0A4R7CTU4_9SPHI|nr:hypothetical protein [Sphingobacterium paludis]TDS09815.1 hypothetical protein B0I21_11092 [Sphingobacterium paludis]
MPEEVVQALQTAPKAKGAPVAFNNNHVPNSYPVDTTKDVGEIPMSSSSTPTGAKMYTVPIEIAPGRQGFQPQSCKSIAG